MQLGDVTTIAGDETSSGAVNSTVDGIGSHAKFVKPTNIRVDNEGKLLVVDKLAGSGIIRRIDAPGKCNFNFIVLLFQ